MPHVDPVAAARLQDLREDRGLSVEALAREIRNYAEKQGWYRIHGAVDAYTLRAIEERKHCPSERVRLVIALYFGVRPREIWEPDNRIFIASTSSTEGRT